MPRNTETRVNLGDESPRKPRENLETIFDPCPFCSRLVTHRHRSKRRQPSSLGTRRVSSFRRKEAVALVLSIYRDSRAATTRNASSRYISVAAFRRVAESQRRNAAGECVAVPLLSCCRFARRARWIASSRIERHRYTNKRSAANESIKDGRRGAFRNAESVESRYTR